MRYQTVIQGLLIIICFYLYDVRLAFIYTFCFPSLSHGCSSHDDATAGRKRPLRRDSRARGGLGRTLRAGVLVLLLTLVGSRVASLVVLEFSLRAISAWVTDGLVRFYFF